MDRAVDFVQELRSVNLKKFQRDAVESVSSGKDVFVCAPTGAGKSLCFYLLPDIFDFIQRSTSGLVTALRPIVIVISPLVALIKDQVQKAYPYDGYACGLTEDTDATVLKGARTGQYRLVYVSPEGILGSHMKLLESEVYQRNTVALIVDEAHCISEWGEGFRPVYQMLGKLRASLPSHIPIMALTATATKEIRTKIAGTLLMSPDAVVISVSPDRRNIMYSVSRVKSGSFEVLRWLVELLQTIGQQCPKTVLFFRNVRSLALAYSYFCKEVGDTIFVGERNWQNKMIAMFHRATHSTNKDFVLSELPKSDSKIRLIFATVAFGMGIDIPDISYVIHFGCARSLEAYSQETGRAGRDGRQAYAITYYHIQDLSQGHSTESMKMFIRGDKCRRQHLIDHFNLGVPQIQIETSTQPSPPLTLCTCCDVCGQECRCGNCSPPLWKAAVSDRELADSSDKSSEQMENTGVHADLIDLVQVMDEDSPPGLFKRSLLCGLSDDVIALISVMSASIEDSDGLCALTGITYQDILETVMGILNERSKDL